MYGNGLFDGRDRSSASTLRLWGRNAQAVFLLGISILVSGCAGALLPKEESQFFQGNMNEIVLDLEPQFEAGKKLASDQLVFLCLAYINKSIISKAIKCADALESAIAISSDNKTFGLGPFSSAPWLIRAEASLATGNYLKAVEFAKAAHRKASAEEGWMVGNQLVWIFRPMSTVAIAYVGLGEVEKAEEVLQTLERTVIPFMGGATAEQALRTELFKVYLALGKYDAYRAKASESNFWLAIGRPLTQATWGQELDTEERIRNQFAGHFVSLKLGDVEQARAGLEGLMRDRSASDFGSIHWKILHVLGGIYSEAGDVALAIERLTEAVDVIEKQRSSIEGEASKIGYVGDKQAVYSDLIDVLIRAGRYKDAFEYIERAKARALVDMLASRQSFSTKESGANTAALIRKLDELEAQSIELAALGNANSRTRGAELNAAKEALQKAAPELASLVTVGVFDASETQARLAGDEVLLEYFGHENKLYAIVVTKIGVDAVKLDGIDLGDEVQNVRLALQAQESVVP